MLQLCVFFHFTPHSHTLGELQKKRGPETRNGGLLWFGVFVQAYKRTHKYSLLIVNRCVTARIGKLSVMLQVQVLANA